MSNCKICGKEIPEGRKLCGSVECKKESMRRIGKARQEARRNE